MPHYKKFLFQIKHHHRNFLIIFLILLITPLIVFSIYALFPPTVRAASQEVSPPLQSLDQSISFTVWGAIDKRTVSATVNPSVPFEIRLNKTLFPLKTRVEIVPQGLFLPNKAYLVSLSVRNFYGLTTTQQFHFRTMSLPKVVKASPKVGGRDILPFSELTFSLSTKLEKGEFVFQAEPQFDFTLVRNANKILVKPKARLRQGQEFNYSLSLKSNQDLYKVFSGKFRTIDPLEITTDPTDTSQLVPRQTTIKFVLSKEVDQTLFDNSVQIEPKVDGNFSWADAKTAIFKPRSILAGSTSYKIKLNQNLTAKDRSSLQETKVINFTTAGAVKVLSFAPNGVSPSLTNPIVVTFDQPVDQGSAESHFSLEPKTSGSFRMEGTKLIFQPKSLARLTVYKITLTAGIVSVGGENSQETFSASFNTSSELKKVIGYSVQGRALNATYFGIGQKKILLVGSMHGSESNTGQMLTSFMNYLRNNQNLIPTDRTFIIIPFANPDGTTTNQRFNSHGVDLNRNWQTPDWQSLTYLQNKSFPLGGGTSPFSEPESVALRDLIATENPSAIISYHASANMVIGDGIATSFGDWYANVTGYTRIKGQSDQEDGMSSLGYVITGTLEDWATRRNIPTLVIEFISSTQNEYSRNFPALKGLLNYFP